MNKDAKTFNKMFPDHKHIKNSIHRDQENFIPKIQGWFKICNLINVIYYINKLKEKIIVISLDEEKSFN